jgi:hypothetical protein
MSNSYGNTSTNIAQMPYSLFMTTMPVMMQCRLALRRCSIHTTARPTHIRRTFKLGVTSNPYGQTADVANWLFIIWHSRAPIYLKDRNAAFNISFGAQLANINLPHDANRQRKTESPRISCWFLASPCSRLRLAPPALPPYNPLHLCLTTLSMLS